MTDSFHTIPSFPDYSVSLDGRVRRDTPAPRATVGQVRRPAFQKGGRKIYSLTPPGGGTKTVGLARLIYEAFVGPIPAGHDICHNDGNSTNNAPGNLRPDTRKGNMADKNEHGTHFKGERNPSAKLTAAQVAEIRAASGVTQQVLADRFGVRQNTVSRIRSGKGWA